MSIYTIFAPVLIRASSDHSSSFGASVDQKVERNAHTNIFYLQNEISLSEEVMPQNYS